MIIHESCSYFQEVKIARIAYLAKQSGHDEYADSVSILQPDDTAVITNEKSQSSSDAYTAWVLFPR